MSNYDFSSVITTGASGMIGSYVDFGMRPPQSELDVLDREATMRFVMAHKPRAIIHLAGATDMERCEREPEYAFMLNAVGTYNIAQAARKAGATLVHISTSRVFRGDKEGPYAEDDMPDPQTTYGHSKYLAETIVRSLAPDPLIVRTCWVFGGGPERDDKFYGKVLRQLNGPEISALDDVRGSPTFGKDLISAIKRLLEGGKRGTFHIANAGIATRYDIARVMAERLKSPAKVRAVQRDHFGSAGGLPSNESISSTQVLLRPWQEALAEYLDTEWKQYLAEQKIIV